jgi:hypothetical protein
MPTVLSTPIHPHQFGQLFGDDQTDVALPVSN